MKSHLSRIGIALVSALLVVSCASSRMHSQGLDEFDQGRYELALQKLEQAVASDPDNLTYKLDLKGRREEAVQKLIGAGDKARAAGDAVGAEAAYKRVLVIESGNSRAAKGLEGVDADRRHAQSVATAAQELQQGNGEQATVRLSGVLSEDPGYAAATSSSSGGATKSYRPATAIFCDGQLREARRLEGVFSDPR